jgi:predicted SPOUT superfamily RNA methylase MTH1
MQERATEKESETSARRRGRLWSLAVALPGSILANAQSAALQTQLAGQIARALAIFQVDEVVIFAERVRNSATPSSHYDQLLARLLQYLECPQYLRQQLFPRSPELQFAGLLSPLDTPHHPRRHEGIPFREGIVVSGPHAGAASDQTAGRMRSRYVHVGWDTPIKIDAEIPLTVGQRVTVQFENLQPSKSNCTETQSFERKRKRVLESERLACPGWTWSRAVVVSRDEPRERLGLYWGYRVRLVSNLAQALSTSGADVKIGTSERGTDLYTTLWCPATSQSSSSSGAETPGCLRPSFVPVGGFRKLLVVFGGVQGLEASYGSADVGKLFDAYVNACPSQGSRTIRTEEALYVVLSAMQSWIHQHGWKGDT